MQSGRTILQCIFCGRYFSPTRVRGTMSCSNYCAVKLSYYRLHEFETPYQLGKSIRENYKKEMISDATAIEKSMESPMKETQQREVVPQQNYFTKDHENLLNELNHKLNIA